MAFQTKTPILRTILTTLRRLYPEHLVDKSWDNTGLLLESPPVITTPTPKNPKILLTIDLTTSVVSEAINAKANVIVTYHPIIFRPLKAITTDNTQQTSLLRLIQAGISVYSPHTAVDAVKGGVNDWLAAGISGGSSFEISRTAIQLCPNVNGTEHEGAGYGRLITLREPVDMGTLVDRAKNLLGIQTIQVALSQYHMDNYQVPTVKTIGVCAGSGGTVFRGAKADVLFTGEMGHHEALAAKESGTSSIVAWHSVTERGYLQVMKESLADMLPKVWEEMEFEAGEDEMLDVESWEVTISQTDEDPFRIL